MLAGWLDGVHVIDYLLQIWEKYVAFLVQKQACKHRQSSVIWNCEMTVCDKQNNVYVQSWIHIRFGSFPNC